MTMRLGRVLQRFVLRTSRSPLRAIWRVAHAGLWRAVGARLVHGLDGSSVFLTGSFASGDPVYGLSDIDLVIVVFDQRDRVLVRRRWQALCRAAPILRGLFPHLWVYEQADLRESQSAPYVTYGLGEAGRAAAFLGHAPLADQMGLLERPGILGPGTDWKRVRGAPPNPPATPRDRQRERVDAWLELQYRWRFAFAVCLDPASYYAASHSAMLVAETARLWLWLSRGELVRGRRPALQHALAHLDDEREACLIALALHDRLHRSPPAPVAALFPACVAISERIANLIAAELGRADHTPVRLLGGTNGADELVLMDWRARTVPPIDWSGSQPRIAEERFELVPDDPHDPQAIAIAARSARGELRPMLRTGALLVQPTTDGWGTGRMRAVQCQPTDPVSFALLEGGSEASFPCVAGWSAVDCARRAVAEHRAWLEGPQQPVGSGPAWVGIHPDSAAATPATIGMLLSAARAALFLTSVRAGHGELALTRSAVVEALGRLSSASGQAAREAEDALVESLGQSRPPPAEVVAALRRVVAAMPDYAHAAQRPQGEVRPLLRPMLRR